MLTLLTLLRDSPDSIDFLRSTLVLRNALDARLVVAHPNREADIPIAAGGGGSVLHSHAGAGETSIHLAREAYDTVCTGQQNCHFRATAMSSQDTLRKQALFADLVVLPARADRLFVEDDLGLLKAALVTHRTPTVILPATTLSEVPSTIVFSWNGLPPAARAIRAALPFVKQAKRLVIFEHAGIDVNRSRLENFLHANGVRPADWHNYGEVRETARSRARSLLADAMEEGCDLLVMGAYGELTESFFRFGRATEKIVSAANIPVLLSS